MSVGLPRSVTAAEYLRSEREADRRSEFWAGSVVAMAGASANHGRIVANFVRELGNALAGGPCEVVPNDLRVKVEATNSYVYPDVVAFCGGGRFEDQAGDVLIDPVFLAEVTSPSTEANDRDRKLRHYLQIPALACYAIVSQREAHVIAVTRSQAGGWALQTVFGLDATLTIPGLDATVPLAAIYDRVRFSEEDSLPETPSS